MLIIFHFSDKDNDRNYERTKRIRSIFLDLNYIAILIISWRYEAEIETLAVLTVLIIKQYFNYRL